MRIIITFFIAFTFFSCEKKELPAPAYDRGDAVTAQVNMTSNYKNQVWFSLSGNIVVSTNFKTDWDIAFEASVAGNHVILNSALGMRAYKTNHTQLSNVTDTAGMAAKETVDSPTGNLDSTAVGDWQLNNTVYIINRGYSETGAVLGFYKLKILSASASSVTFEYADVFGSQTYQGTINKDNQYNFQAYSFSSHQQLLIEPAKTSYDLCFTQFTHVFHNPFQFYLNFFCVQIFIQVKILTAIFSCQNSQCIIF